MRLISLRRRLIVPDLFGYYERSEGVSGGDVSASKYVVARILTAQ
jgi:hypothetical protein